MATYSQMAGLAKKRQGKLKKQISKAEDSIAAWKGEVKQLDALVSSLEGMGRGKSARGPRKGTRGRKRGTWKPGSRGRPPQWYVEQQKAAGKQKPAQKATKRKTRKKRVSPKVLAGLAKAREALAAKRKAASQKQ